MAPVTKQFLFALIIFLLLGSGCGQEDLVFPDAGKDQSGGTCGAAYPAIADSEENEQDCYCIQEGGTFPCLVWESVRLNGQDTYISATGIYLDAKHEQTNSRSLVIVVSAENCSTCAVLIAAIKQRAADFEAAGAYMVGMARRSLTGNAEEPDFDLDKAEIVLASEAWPTTWPITNDAEGYLSRAFDTATPWIIVVDLRDMGVRVASNQRFTPDHSGVEELLQFIDEF